MANPLNKKNTTDEQYKIITLQSKLNQILQDTIVSKQARLRRLKILASRKFLHLRGIIYEPDVRILTKKTGEIFFDIKLRKDEVHSETVVLEIVNFKIFAPGKRFDIVKWIDKAFGKVKTEILTGFTGANSPLFLIEHQKKLGFDLNFFLRQIPAEMDVLGKIRIENVAFEAGKIVWYIESNILLKSVLSFFRPDYMIIEKIDANQDVISLLTDIHLE